MKFRFVVKKKRLHQPYLVIIFENAFSRLDGRRMYENDAPAHKFLHVTKDATLFEMYDGNKYVRENVAVIADFFEKYL